MNQPEWWLLFFLAIAIGYLLGRRDARRRHLRHIEGLSRNYMRGLNFLLNEQPDKAIEIFVRSLAVSEHTLETHLALARVFRRRGELDRATLIHSNLLDHPQLPLAAREDVELELAQDFLSAGMLDRAEDILQQMLERGSRHDALVMRLLLSIFEQEKDWHNAIGVAERLRVLDPSVTAAMSHYCCELADSLITDNQTNAARRCLRRALTLDKRCVRASLLQARLAMQQEQWELAIRALRRVRRQEPVFFDEVLDDLEYCYLKLSRSEQFVQYLGRLCVDSPSTAIIVKLAEHLRRQLGDRAATLFLADHVKAHPSLRGLRQVLEINGDTGEDSHGALGVLKQLADKLLQQGASYQCRDCGFEAQRQHWQCPSCKHWGSLKPTSEKDN